MFFAHLLTICQRSILRSELAPLQLGTRIKGNQSTRQSKRGSPSADSVMPNYLRNQGKGFTRKGFEVPCVRYMAYQKYAFCEASCEMQLFELVL